MVPSTGDCAGECLASGVRDAGGAHERGSGWRLPRFLFDRGVPDQEEPRDVAAKLGQVRGLVVRAQSLLADAVVAVVQMARETHLRIHSPYLQMSARRAQ